MKKFIQAFSLLSIIVFGSVFSATAKTAQPRFGTEVEIPFAFNIGNRAYEAGSYVIKLGRISPNVATLLILDLKSDEMQTVLVNVNSERSGGDMRLVFDTIDGQRYLTKIRTDEKTFALFKTKSEKSASR